MPHQYEARRGPRRAGPFSWTELRQHAASGRIGPTDLIRTDRSGHWVLADSIPGLFDQTETPEPALARSGSRVVSAPPPPLPHADFPSRTASPRPAVASGRTSPQTPLGPADANPPSPDKEMTRREWWHPWLLGFASLVAGARSCGWLRHDKPAQQNPPRPK